jgi:holo-[acyl-carrier protein] synthase
MILGIGTDIVNVNRIKTILHKFPHKLADKILSNQEMLIFTAYKNLEHKAAYLAKRFAGKEAFCKAMGQGLAAIGMKNLSILNKESGKPYLSADINFAKHFEDAPNIGIEISLSDEKTHCLAFVVLWARSF